MDNQALAEQLISVTGFSEDYEMVIDLGEKFLELYDSSGIIYYFTGVAYHMNDNSGKALEIFQEAIDVLDMDNEFLLHIYSYLGDIYHDKGDYSKSDKYFGIAIEIDDQNLLTLNNYAYYLSLREEKLETALKYSLITVQNEPGNSSYLDTYAWILYKLKKFDEAVKYIELAYEKSESQSFEILKHYGAILLELGKFNEAKELLYKAKELTNEKDEIAEIDNLLDRAN